MRSFDAASQDLIEAALKDCAAGVGLSFGCEVEVGYTRYYPATVNSAAQAKLALQAATAAGLEASEASRPAFTSEDFAFMLHERPGAYLWLGQGPKSVGEGDYRPLHHPCYDFNDRLLPIGLKWFAQLVELELAPTSTR